MYMPTFVFFGSSDYSLPVLNRLIEKGISVSAVVTTPDKPVGRHLKLTPNPVAVLAENHHLTIYKSLKDLSSHLPLTTHNQQLIGLVAAYGKIIPQKILDLFNTHIYNIHPSLLPKYRGPSPLQQQILDGVTETGVTVIQIDAEMDHGPILAQEKASILPTDTPPTLGERLFLKGTDMFINDCLNQQLTTYNLQLTPQDHSQATFTHLLTRQDGFIEYTEFINNLKIENLKLKIERAWRAYSPWPGIWTIDPSGKRMKLVSLSPLMIQKEGQKPYTWPF